MAASTILKYPLNDIALGTIVYSDNSNASQALTSAAADIFAQSVSLAAGTYVASGSYTITCTGNIGMKGISIRLSDASTSNLLEEENVLLLGGDTTNSTFSASINGVSVMTFNMPLSLSVAGTYNFAGLSSFTVSSSSMARTGYSIAIVKMN